MRDNYQFILSARASHFRSMSKTVSIPKNLGHWCNWRTSRSRRGIHGLLIGCHSIQRCFVLRLRVTSHVLWQNLHASYPSQAHESVNSNLAAACEVLGVVDELLMNPVSFHVDDPSRLINGRSD
jgi:hypothetical protein